MGAQDSPAPKVATERAMLMKFEGDLTPEECETATPVEVVLSENGVIVAVLRGEEVKNIPPEWRPNADH